MRNDRFNSKKVGDSILLEVLSTPESQRRDKCTEILQRAQQEKRSPSEVHYCTVVAALAFAFPKETVTKVTMNNDFSNSNMAGVSVGNSGNTSIGNVTANQSISDSGAITESLIELIRESLKEVSVATDLLESEKQVVSRQLEELRSEVSKPEPSSRVSGMLIRGLAQFAQFAPSLIKLAELWASNNAVGS